MKGRAYEIHKGRDTGISAVPKDNVEVDGTLKADTTKQNIVVLKDGTETIVGEFTQSISSNSITELFQEGQEIWLKNILIMLV